MSLFVILRAVPALALMPAVIAVQTAFAQGDINGDINKVKHVIIVMQENHSFDNYFGALAFAPGSPYHAPGGYRDRDDSGRGCQEANFNQPNGTSHEHAD